MSGEVEFGLEFGQYVCYVLCWKKKIIIPAWPSLFCAV